jgi:hypothetical protein
MRKKIFVAASFLPLAVNALPVNAETAERIEFPTYSIDFRRAVQIAQVELAKTARSGLANESEVITSKASGGYKDGKDAGGSKNGSGAANDGYKTDGGYKESKGAGGSKANSGKGPDAYTTGGYKESKGAGGAKSDAGADNDGYKTAGGYKEGKAAGSSAKGDDGADGYKTAGGYKEGGSADGYKTAGGYKEGKDAGASDASAGKGGDGYKTSGGLVEYMKSGRSGLGSFDHKADGGLKMSAEDSYKRAPRGLGGVKMDSEGGTTGALKLESEGGVKGGVERGAGAPDAIRPIGGEAAGPVKELQVATPVRAAPVLAPASPVLAPATPVAKPAIGGAPLLVPSVLPTK